MPGDNAYHYWVDLLVSIALANGLRFAIREGIESWWLGQSYQDFGLIFKYSIFYIEGVLAKAGYLSM